MNNSLDLAQFQKIWAQAQAYFSQHVLSWSMAVQIVVIGCTLLLAYKISGGMRSWLTRQQEQYATNQEAGADLVILLDAVKVIDAFLAFILLAIPIISPTISTGATMNCMPQPCCWLA
jgi:hypothetical protein